jgi:hypothetical protein
MRDPFRSLSFCRLLSAFKWFAIEKSGTVSATGAIKTPALSVCGTMAGCAHPIKKPDIKMIIVEKNFIMAVYDLLVRCSLVF